MCLVGFVNSVVNKLRDEITGSPLDDLSTRHLGESRLLAAMSEVVEERPQPVLPGRPSDMDYSLDQVITNNPILSEILENQEAMEEDEEDEMELGSQLSPRLPSDFEDDEYHYSGQRKREHFDIDDKENRTVFSDSKRSRTSEMDSYLKNIWSAPSEVLSDNHWNKGSDHHFKFGTDNNSSISLNSVIWSTGTTQENHWTTTLCAY